MYIIYIIPLERDLMLLPFRIIEERGKEPGDNPLGLEIRSSAPK